MLNIEQIENIVKSKYKKVELIGKMFEFCHNENKSKGYYGHKELILCSKENKLIYNQKTIDMDGVCDCEKFEIENNAIELKHYLNIEITQQDIIDWLSFIDFKHNNNNYYVESNKNHLILCKIENVDYEINGSATAEIESSFLFIPRYKTVHIPIHKKFKKELKTELFKATNSQEYWQLYQIIKNLKG